MSCSGCTKKYGLFLRESGCPKCGFSFCSKCLKYTITEQKRKVCSGCFHKYTQPADKPTADIPKESPSVNHQPVPPPKPTIQANPDEQLQNRLESLKKADEPSPQSDALTDLHLKERLAKLQDQKFVEEKPNRDIFQVDTKSEQEKVNDLVERYFNEAAIDTASDPVKDLEDRLNRLRAPVGGTAAATTSESSNKPRTIISDNGDDSDDDKRYVKKILAEAMLDAQLNYTEEEKELLETIPKPPKEGTADLEELPWCTICNEDAKLRCLGCDGELYCNACFKEIHDDEEYKQHRTKPYQKPKSAGVESDNDSD